MGGSGEKSSRYRVANWHSVLAVSTSNATIWTKINEFKLFIYLSMTYVSHENYLYMKYWNSGFYQKKCHQSFLANICKTWDQGKKPTMNEWWEKRLVVDCMWKNKKVCLSFIILNWDLTFHLFVWDHNRSKYPNSRNQELFYIVKLEKK